MQHVAENDGSPSFFKIAGSEGSYRCGRTDRHENRCGKPAVCRLHDTGSCAGGMFLSF